MVKIKKQLKFDTPSNQSFTFLSWLEGAVTLDKMVKVHPQAHHFHFANGSLHASGDWLTGRAENCEDPSIHLKDRTKKRRSQAGWHSVFVNTVFVQHACFIRAKNVL